MKCQIEATIIKCGGEPVHWYRFSDKALSEQDCLKMLSIRDENQFNRPRKDEIKIRLEQFCCRKVKR
ncbi:DUF1187 family protein [Candidatus Arsenophonus triatominarum]|uniref:DUF1187 family protein n=1 Tax=Candidatus Arsenophonus triatominarum TaxID=57911 RepID=UPI000B0C1657